MSQADSGSSPGWFHDQETLLAVVRRARPPRATPPTIPGYDDLRELHRGGQGVVYSATQRSTKRRVAIKVLLDGAFASEPARRRFEREVDLIASLRHPHIVTIYDSGRTESGQPYLVMELLDGVTLGEWSRDCPGDEATRVRRKLEVCRAVCEAVNHAHQRGVMHRDLKPSNIRVDEAGAPHVLDFGLAKTIGADGPGATVTEAGRFVGSLPWASPEQARGDPGAIDTRSDVYSLGVILYQLLTGRFPYDVDSGFRSAIENIISAEPSRPGLASPHAGGDVEVVTLRCLAKDPARRYQSAGELADDLGRVLAGEPIAARRDSAWQSLRRRAGRYRAWLIASGAAALVSMGALAVSVVYWRRAESANSNAVEALGSAQRQTRRAESTSKYLTGALRSPDPSVKGRDVRVADVLDQAAKDAGVTLADQPETLIDVRMTLASTYLGLSLYDQADEQAGLALELAQATRGKDSGEAVRCANLLARARQHRGRLGEAEALNREWLPIARRVLGDDDPQTLSAMATQATLLGQSGKFADAEAAWRDLVEIRTKTLGEDHEETLTALGRQAQMLARQSKHREAIEVIRRVLAARVRVLGPEAPDTISSMSDLAWNTQQTGDLAGADRLFEQAAALSEKVNGPEHAMTLIILNNRAGSLVKLGRAAEAEAIYRKLLDTQMRLRGADHEQTLNVTNGLATCLRGQGRAAEALPLAERIVQVATRTQGPAHPSVLNYSNTLGATLLPLGRGEEALAIFERIWPAAKEKLGERHVLTCGIRSNLARALAARGGFEEAAGHAEAAYASATGAFGEASPQSTDAAAAAAEVYAAWGKAEAAKEWRGKAGGAN
ncbi:eukaryotic-like serine/threonine-protein kinase [Phycisphaerales bacterium]|nr:eukaryotic-like serine/threonine-protein kinase [Phycisphaerales bacterium]